MATIGGCVRYLPDGETSGPSQRWIAAEGGLAEQALQERAADIADRLAAVLDPQSRPFLVRVTRSPRLQAHAWGDGTVFISAGLVQYMNETEVAAAIAHELGHLLDDGHLHGPVSLTGTAPADAETRADLLACKLLAEAGYPPQAMAALLEQVSSRQRDRRIRQMLRRRIQHLQAAMP